MSCVEAPSRRSDGKQQACESLSGTAPSGLTDCDIGSGSFGLDFEQVAGGPQVAFLFDIPLLLVRYSSLQDQCKLDYQLLLPTFF